MGARAGRPGREFPMRLGVPELVIILLIVVLIFGANRLPELGKGIGRGIKNFKDATRHAPTRRRHLGPRFRRLASRLAHSYRITRRRNAARHSFAVQPLEQRYLIFRLDPKRSLNVATSTRTSACGDGYEVPRRCTSRSSCNSGVYVRVQRVELHDALLARASVLSACADVLAAVRPAPAAIAARSGGVSPAWGMTHRRAPRSCYVRAMTSGGAWRGRRDRSPR